MRTVIQNPRLSEKLEIRPIDCLDYRLTANLVESIGDYSVEIGREAIILGGIERIEDLSQLFLQLHRITYTSYENAMKSVFSHNISVAESVRMEREKITLLFHEIETLARTHTARIAQHMLTAASSISRIYENSLDIADLVMPRLM